MILAGTKDSDSLNNVTTFVPVNSLTLAYNTLQARSVVSVDCDIRI